MVIKIAIDVMGGDHAPTASLQACENYLKNNPDSEVFFHLYGKSEVLTPIIQSYQSLPQKSAVIHCAEVIDANVKPFAALRGFDNASMKMAINSVKNKESDCVISAGNTGALMALSKIILKNIPGISRPAIVTSLPTLQKNTLLLDIGANLDCNTDNLVDFAILGSAYYQTAVDSTCQCPRVAILNIGTEEIKGHKIIQDAYEILQNNLQGKIDFQGYIESSRIFYGNVDVIVTDGFTGNIAVKAATGVADIYTDQLKKVFQTNFLTKISAILIKKHLKNTLKKFSKASANNGGPFLGLNGIVLKAHGYSDANIIENVITTAISITQNHLIDKINESVIHFTAQDAAV